jgi:hypothetical protein
LASRRGARGFGQTWLWAALTFFLLAALWALATPLGAAPDEPTQIVKAASVVRGQIVGPAAVGSPGFTVVEVPYSLAADANMADCFALKPSVTASCDIGFPGSGKAAAVTTYVGRYPPLYYALVGLPSLWAHGDGAVYAMRLLSALWSALLCGLAMAVARSSLRTRLLTVGVGLVATPMCAFLAGVVNPSGLEISAALCAWTSGLTLVLGNGVVRDGRERPPPSVLAAFLVSVLALALTRGLSLLWIFILVAALVALAPARVLALCRQRRPAALFAGAGLVGVAEFAYVLVAKTLWVQPGRPVSGGSSTAHVIHLILDESVSFLVQLVGDFGWVDTPSPVVVVWLWAVLAVLILTVVLVSVSRRALLVVGGLALLSLALPTAIMASQANKLGIVWQARDGLPLYMGVPLVACASWQPGRATLGRRPLVVGVICAGGVQLFDFFWALRRYVSGFGGTLNIFGSVPGGWTPPIPVAGLLSVALVVCVAYTVLLSRAVWPLGGQRKLLAAGGVPGVAAGLPGGPAGPRPRASLRRRSHPADGRAGAELSAPSASGRAGADRAP